MKKNLQTVLSLLIALLFVLSFAACGNKAAAANDSDADGQVFQAENAEITDGTGMWPPITEIGLDVTTDTPVMCPGISNIGDGSALTWTLTADKAAPATITLRVASHLKDWGNPDSGTIGVDDASEALELTVNGQTVAIGGEIPGGAVLPSSASGGTAYKIVSITADVNLVAGENVITFTSLDSMETVNLFMDKLIVKTNANLTWTETDNSERVWGMQ